MASLIWSLVDLRKLRTVEKLNTTKKITRSGDEMRLFFATKELNETIWRLPVLLGSDFPPQLVKEIEDNGENTDPFYRALGLTTLTLVLRKVYSGENLACFSCGIIRGALPSQSQFKL